MLPVLSFIAIIIAVFTIGTILSYPLHIVVSSFSDTGLHKAVHYSILLTGLGLGIVYLRKTHALSAMFGHGLNPGEKQRQLLAGLAAGLAILLTVEVCLYLLGLRQADPDLAEGITEFLITVVKAVITGFIVALMEETLFRGAIFTGLARYTNSITALVISSVFYSAVHFIDFPQPAPGSEITWLSSFDVLINAFSRFGDPLILDSFISLTVLGFLFGMMRWRTGNIILCIGAHAGIVTINKVFSYSADYKPGSIYEYLVNAYDHQTGVLASFWLFIACLIYYFGWMKDKKEKG